MTEEAEIGDQAVGNVVVDGREAICARGFRDGPILIRELRTETKDGGQGTMAGPESRALRSGRGPFNWEA